MARIIFHINERIQHAKVPKIVRGQQRLEWEGQTMRQSRGRSSAARGTCCHNLPPRVGKCAIVAHNHHEVPFDYDDDASDDVVPVQCLELCLAEHRMWQPREREREKETPNTEQGVYGDLVSYVDRKHF